MTQDNDPAHVLHELATAIDKVSDLVLKQPIPDEDVVPIDEQAIRLNNILAAVMLK